MTHKNLSKANNPFWFCYIYGNIFIFLYSVRHEYKILFEALKNIFKYFIISNLIFVHNSQVIIEHLRILRTSYNLFYPSHKIKRRSRTQVKGTTLYFLNVTDFPLSLFYGPAYCHSGIILVYQPRQFPFRSILPNSSKFYFYVLY